MLHILNMIDVHIMAILILTIILVIIILRRENTVKQGRLFIFFVISAMAAVFFEACSIVTVGIPNASTIAFQTLWNTLLYIVSPFVTYLWVIYIYYCIYGDDDMLSKFSNTMIVPLLINSVLILTNPYTHLYFTIDINGLFERGGFYLYMSIVMLFYGIYSMYLVKKNKDTLGKSTSQIFFYTMFLPIISGILQVFMYGITIIWFSLVIGIFVVYLNIQDKMINIDYLTKAYNRRQLEIYLIRKINDIKIQDFTGYMFDIDNFKDINDTYGHVTGDKALKEMVHILKSVYGRNAFIARFAGDEFIVISDTVDDINNIRIRLNNAFNKANNTKSKEYTLNASVGSAVYKADSSMSAENFLNILDADMFKSKKLKSFKRRSTDR